jgi:membrane protein DedA with SNARE-associated domain
VQFAQDLGIWAYLLLGLLVMVEGPIATLAGAVAASAGLMQPVGVFLSASLANMLADCLWYTLGYLGKMEWVHRYGGYVGVREPMVARFQADIQKHAAKLLFLAKLTLGFTIPTLVATGLARVPMRRWFPVLIVSETLWTGSLVALGFYFGKYAQTLERGIEVIAIGGVFLFAAGLFIYISHQRKRSAEKKRRETTE